jgi:hypothetical protein
MGCQAHWGRTQRSTPSRGGSRNSKPSLGFASRRQEPRLPSRIRWIVLAARGRSLSLVADANFVVATRDTGYKSSAYAVAELIDNAIQAGAPAID